MNMYFDNSKASNVEGPEEPGVLDKIGTAITEIIKGFLDSVQIVVILLAFIVVVYLWVLSLHQVDGQSMMPNYINKEFVLADKVVSGFSPYKRGDVLIFKYDDTKDFIKRVVALPGERVKMSQGKVFINGKELKEPYIPEGRKTNPTNYNFMGENQEKVVPDGSYFLLGDNREHSTDSRAIGFISPDKYEIRGRVFLILNRFKFLDEPKYNI